MDLVDIDPRLVGQGPMSHVSYDSHVVTRQRMVDEMPRVGQQQQGEAETYDQAMMEGEIQRVSRELYKAFSGMNQGFTEAKDQIAIDELSTHTDIGRQEAIHPYKTLYGRDINSVLKDNLGVSWEEACASLMTEMRMYELECLRRRMEDEQRNADNNSVISSVIKSPSLSVKSSKASKSPKSARSKSTSNGSVGKGIKIEESAEEAEEEKFTGHSCLLITWKTNPEVENFKNLYMDKEIKTHKRKNTNLVDPGDLVSEKSLAKNYRIIGKGEGLETLLVKGKKEGQVDEVDGDHYRYFLLAGTSRPYPDDTFYSVGRVPRKLLMKYLGVKMYLVRLRQPPIKDEGEE